MSQMEPLACSLLSYANTRAGSYCGLLLGVERAPLGQIIWSMGEFPLLFQISASVTLLPFLLSESLLVLTLVWVLPMNRALLQTPPGTQDTGLQLPVCRRAPQN